MKKDYRVIIRYQTDDYEELIVRCQYIWQVDEVTLLVDDVNISFNYGTIESVNLC